MRIELSEEDLTCLVTGLEEAHAQTLRLLKSGECLQTLRAEVKRQGVEWFELKERIERGIKERGGEG